MTTILFRSATLVALLHGLDDAVEARRALAAALALALATAAVVAFPRLRPGLRALLSLSFGALALVNGAQHVAGDHRLTGLLAAVAGLVLAGLAVAIPLAHRGTGSWTSRAAVAAGGGLALWFATLPLALAIVQTHKHREPVPAPPSAAYREVSFRAADGVRLAGWYVPSANRAAVLLVHGGGGDRTGALAHARMLARHGYGVLLYDARGRGESGGSWPVFAATRLLSGSGPGRPLAELVPRVAPTPLLLISSGRFPRERELNERYAAAARPPFAWWDLRDVRYTAGIRERPAAYERRVVGFIDRATGVASVD